MRTIVINPTYTHLREWLEQLPTTFDHTGEIIYSARNQIRVMSTPDGRQVCVKRFHKPLFPNRLFYTFCRPPKAKRAYDNSLELLHRGIGTPEPVAYLLEFPCGLLGFSYLVTLQSSLHRNFYEFQNGDISGKEDILRAFARYTAHVHEQGVYHLDYSPGNILFDQKDGEWKFEMIDINRLQFKPSISIRQGSRNFARLWGKEDLHRTIAQAYAEARNGSPDDCIREALRAREQFWRHRRHSFFVYD